MIEQGGRKSNEKIEQGEGRAMGRLRRDKEEIWENGGKEEEE